MLSVWSHRVGAVQPCAFSKSRTIAKLLCTSLSEPYLPGGWTENLGGWTENLGGWTENFLGGGPKIRWADPICGFRGGPKSGPKSGPKMDRTILVLFCSIIYFRSNNGSRGFCFRAEHVGPGVLTPAWVHTFVRIGIVCNL